MAVMVNVNHLHSLTKAPRVPSENAKYARFTFGQHVGGGVKKKKERERELGRKDAEFLA